MLLVVSVMFLKRAKYHGNNLRQNHVKEMLTNQDGMRQAALEHTCYLSLHSTAIKLTHLTPTYRCVVCLEASDGLWLSSLGDYVDCLAHTARNCNTRQMATPSQCLTTQNGQVHSLHSQLPHAMHVSDLAPMWQHINSGRFATHWMSTEYCQHMICNC
jgi:hypothetical protein